MIMKLRLGITLIFLFFPTLATAQSPLESWEAGKSVTMAQVEVFGLDKCFTEQGISDEIFERMKGKSYKDGCTIPLSELRYIKVLHITINKEIRLGEMVVNRAISREVIAIFRELFEAKYPIEKMVLVDEYNADDNASMADNNSSAFNYRTIPSRGRLSAHSRGMAIDINPLYNPYIKQYPDKTLIAPKEAKEYANRNTTFPYKIERDDLCCQLFRQYGFEWGGDYKSIKDYQHFEK